MNFWERLALTLHEEGLSVPVAEEGRLSVLARLTPADPPTPGNRCCGPARPVEPARGNTYDRLASDIVDCFLFSLPYFFPGQWFSETVASVRHVPGDSRKTR